MSGGFDLPPALPRSKQQPVARIRRNPALQTQDTGTWNSPPPQTFNPSRPSSSYSPYNLPPMQLRPEPRQAPVRPSVPFVLQPGVDVSYRPRFPIYRDMVYQLSVDDVTSKSTRPTSLPAQSKTNLQLPVDLILPPPAVMRRRSVDSDDIPLSQVVAQQATIAQQPEQPSVDTAPALKPEPALAPQPEPTPSAKATPLEPAPLPKREASYSDSPIAMTGEMQPSSAFLTDIWEEEDKNIDDVSIVLDALRRQRDEEEEQEEVMSRIAQLLRGRNTGRSYTSSTIASRSSTLMSFAIA